MNPRIKLLPHQLEFIKSNALHTALCGGYGSGKSEGAVLKTIQKKLELPGVNVAYYLPTYPLIEDVAFPKFEALLIQHGVQYDLNKSYKNITTPYGKIILRSMDNPSRIIGYEVGYSLIDEVDILPKDKMKDVFSKIIARNRVKLPDGKSNITDVVGTPEGYLWMYEYFIKNGNKNRKIIHAKTKSNPFLPESYIETLKETYTEQQLLAYLEGEFVNLTSGSVYYNYDRDLNNTNEVAGPTDTIHVGIDFNIGNMHAIIHKIGKYPLAVDEITKAHDTDHVAELLRQRYPDNRIYCYPDASGKNRSSNATITDIGILKKAGFEVKANSRNPLVMDRVKNMNRMFLNGKGERSYFVNKAKCPDYSEALERMPFDKNGTPDKTSGFDHGCDAGGYFISYMYPLKKFDAFWN